MFRLSTYFYWSLVLLIRIYRWFELQLLRVIKIPVNKYIISNAPKYGIVVNGKHGGRPTEGMFNLTVTNNNTFIRIINSGSMGLGESYMEGWWSCDDNDDLEIVILKVWDLIGDMKPHPMLRLADWILLNADETPWEVESKTGWIRPIGMDFYKAGLGPKMNFSAGVWTEAQKEKLDLDGAQDNALKFIGEKLKLTPGMKVLDLGCGYGGLARYLADQHGVFVTGVTNSTEEASAAKAFANDSVEIVLSDYRTLPDSYIGKFDRVVSIHLIEHLGSPRHYKTFFSTANKYLKSDGLFMLQCYMMYIKQYIRTELFTRKYFVRSTVVPHIDELMSGIDQLFFIEQIQSLSHNLEPFFRTAENNFEKAWPTLNYDNSYYRLLKLLNKTSIAMVLGKKMHDLCFVLSKRT